MAAITKFEEIETWQSARVLANLIYDLSGCGEFSRDYGLKDQIRRAVVSVMSNIAEGFESISQALFINFLGTAKASAGEVRSQLYIALDRNYISAEQFDQAHKLVMKTSRQLYRFMLYLESQPNTRRLRENALEYETLP